MTTATEAPAVQVQVQVGDFFVCSWGYDQTNVDFYRVVGVTPSGKSVRVQQWTSTIRSGAGSPQEDVVPGDKPKRVRVWSAAAVDQVEQDAPVTLHRIRRDWSSPAFTVNSFSVATLWDGKPEYRTGAGWGR